MTATKKTAKGKKKLPKKSPKKKKSPLQTPTTKKRELFIERLAQTCNVSEAARHSGYDRVDAYKYKDKDPKFAKAWDNAIEQAIEKLEYTARERAIHQSDTLMIFLLKAHRPEKYRERTQVQHTTEDGKPFTFIMNLGGDPKKQG